MDLGSVPARRALVWFKRDLRVHDHAPLVAAQACKDALALFVIEPEWLQSPECDASHVEFLLACLAELREALALRGLPLLVRVGSVVPVLAQLHSELAFTHLLSHEETGPGWTYRRDLQVAAWCKTASIAWQEFTQTGVVRRLPSRTGWAQRWQARMDAPVHRLDGSFTAAVALAQAELPDLASLGLAPHRKTLQAAGEKAARRMLKSFLQVRGYNYRKALSSPLSAEQGCSRLSPHLAFGTLSLRTVHQATEQAIARAPDRELAYALRGFAGRLRWHCHFMQKLEDEPGIEFHNFARVCDGLREDDFNDGHFAAWCTGRTGYPMVDACMRSLVATGWLNFRMRAMLVSFASYHLWLHWRQTGLFLARQFLDYEAGIHWSQMQMQSGTTGINTLRIYSPTKQALDQDPQGLFIRRWVPELGRVPLPYLAEPWKMDLSVQRLAGCGIGVDYPCPIVDDKAATQAAKDRMYGLRKTEQAREEADQVQARHGSRKSGLPTSAPRRKSKAAVPPSLQGELFA
ncbi:DNA photolyase family protein [Paucibacter sp. B2R-40]|uniref:FAD-binding domain-containing protein n=1 Tax=Paucibacter sp. B2R-40 TaxID=2893554 RepID=UPI0021E3D564|nr:deoxyribodipyrimidine photo-lyase [Paucibacter sp. B2R-40]MCV2352936.1 DNA photolyase family protein [Paucibacter sp. B2R-40]